MTGFFERRNFAATSVVVVVLLLASLCEARLSYSFAFGALDPLVGFDAWIVGLMVVRIALLVPVIGFWLVNKPRALLYAIVALTATLTLGVAVSCAALVTALLGPIATVGDFFVFDLVLLGVANVLVFSIWFWLIDPPGIQPGERADDEWEFLFPQRNSLRARDKTWVPGYIEYLYASYVVSFTFGPADVVPLSRRAKILIMIETTISLIIIAVLAANVISAVQGT
jgi:hypothetical protein